MFFDFLCHFNTVQEQESCTCSNKLEVYLDKEATNMKGVYGLYITHLPMAYIYQMFSQVERPRQLNS